MKHLSVKMQANKSEDTQPFLMSLRREISSSIVKSNTMMSMIVCFIIAMAIFVSTAECNDNLRVAYEWKEIDYIFDGGSEQRWTAIEKGEFVPNNVIPFGLEVYRSRLFITLPRWKHGVPASLAYINLSDNSTNSPSLIPYPSWQAHNLNESEPELVSPFRVRADRCGRLWVLDSRIAGVLERTKLYGTAQLLVYDLHSDNLLRRHRFPANQVKKDSFFANLAVEDGDCENTFAYAGDLGSPGLVVYSWQQQDSWRVSHNFFHPDPLAGNFSIGGIEFQWDDGLYGLALSKAQQTDGYATLYFHPLSSTMEFAVNTTILRNKTLATSGQIYREFKILGSRGPNAQAGASFLDQLTGVLFYALPNLNAVACWKTSNRAYTIKSQGRVYMSNSLMVFPSDVSVDDQDRLWVLSNRLHQFIYDELFPGPVNFRILTAHVKEAIENTACDINRKPLPEIINKLGDILNTATNRTQKPVGSSTQVYHLNVLMLLFAITLTGLWPIFSRNSL